MKFLVSSLLFLVVRAEEAPELSFLKEGVQFKCNGPPANRPCPDPSKPYPYVCTDGATLCCSVKIMSNMRSARQVKKLMREAYFDKHGNCYLEKTDVADA